MVDIGVMTPEKQAALALLQSRGAPLTGENLARALTIVYRGQNSNDLRPVGDFDMAMQGATGGRTASGGTKRAAATTGTDRSTAGGTSKPSGASASTSSTATASSSDKPFDRAIERTADITRPGDVRGREMEKAPVTQSGDSARTPSVAKGSGVGTGISDADRATLNEYGVTDPDTSGIPETWSNMPDWLKALLGIGIIAETGAKGKRVLEAVPMPRPPTPAITDATTRVVGMTPRLTGPAADAAISAAPLQLPAPQAMRALPAPDGSMRFYEGGAPVIDIPSSIAPSPTQGRRVPGVSRTQPRPEGY